MPTVEERYQAATAYVHHAIKTVDGQRDVFDPISAIIEGTATYEKTAPVENELERIEARWLRSKNDDERERVARDAELLADRTEENLPGAPQDWPRTNLYPGEVASGTPATSYTGELEQEAAEAWGWAKQKASDAAAEAKGLGKWILVGGGALLGWKVVGHFRARERQRNRRARQSTRRLLGRAVEHAAESPRSASGFDAYAMCPICHRYKFKDGRGRLVAHEYPSGGMCPGGGQRPLQDEDTPKPRRWVTR